MSWRRILLLSLVFVAALGGVTWGFLQRSDAATTIVRRELQALFRPRTELTTTELDVGRGRLSALGLRIDDPRRPGAALLTVARVDVDVAIAGSGAFVDAHAVTAEGVVLTAGPGFPTAAELLAPRDAAPSSPPRLPPITLRDSRIVVTVREGQPPIELTGLQLQLVPRQDAPWVSVRGEATLAELGARLELTGDVDPASGAATLTATLRSATVDAKTIARVAALLGIEPPVIAAGATVRSLRITATSPAGQAGDRTPRLELVAELADVQVKGGGLPDIVKSATIDLQASNAAGGRATVHLRQRTPNGSLEVHGQGLDLLGEPTIDLRVHGTDVLIDAEILAALRLFDTGREIVAALQPTTGRADLELFLRNPQRRGGIAELDLSLRDVAMSFLGFGDGDERTGFPLPMQRTSGRVRLRDNVVLLEDVQASITAQAGGGTVRLQGRIDGKQPAGEDASLDIRAEGVAFSPDLRSALNTLLDDGGALYDKFAPVGRTEVDVTIRPRRELPGGWSVDVRPQASSMQWAGFPYRLDGLRGSVQARDDGVTFDLSGQHGGGQLTMRGHIPLVQAPGDARGFVADVVLDAITIDDDLRAAVAVLAPDLDGPWRACAPSGRFAGRVKVWRPRPEDPLFHDARLEFLGVDLLLPAAPWRAVGMQGPVIVQGLGTSTRVDFDALRGELAHGSDTPAKLAMLGNVVVGEAAGEDLAFVVRDLELDGQLGRTLEDLGALGPGTWASLQPSGRVDLVCRHRRSGAVTQPLHLVVHLLDVRSEAPILLRPAEHMTGELQIADGELRFDDVRAVLGGAQVTASAGRVRTRPAPDSRTEIAFTVDARGVPIDDGVANLFSGPLRRAVLQRQLLGRADVDSLRLQFAIPTRDSKEPFTTTLAGQLRLYDLDMTLGEGIDGILVHGIDGVATLAESTVSEQGGQLRGALRGVSMRLFGQPIEAIDAAFVADAERITIEALTARCHGGVLRSARQDAPAIHYLLPGQQAPEGRLQADLTFENVDVYTFLDRGGWTNPPYSGAASGTLTLERLDGSSVIGAVGRGSIKLERADLGVVPLFTAIYAQLPAADRPRFDGLDVTWQVADRRVEFERFDVRSKILAARGKGKLGFDGYLDVEMQLDNLLGTSADPFVMPLISYLAQNVVTFHLHGYLRDLRAEKRWVTEGAPARRPVAPMPPSTSRPTAPDF